MLLSVMEPIVEESLIMMTTAILSVVWSQELVANSSLFVHDQE
jgi:hypothetical protein